MFWKEDNDETEEQNRRQQQAEEAGRAFQSPSQLVKQRLHARSPTNTNTNTNTNNNNNTNNYIERVKSGETALSSPGRRAPSVISSPEDQKVFDDLVASTGVVMKKGNPKGGFDPQTVMSRADAAIAGANSVVRSTNNDEGENSSYNNSTINSTLNSGASAKSSLPSKQVSTSSKSKGAANNNTSSSQTTPRSHGGLDLKTNDNSFHVIAQVIVDKFQEQLASKQSIITITQIDKLQLDRMVPERLRLNFIDAVKYRLKLCPEHSERSIHVLTRNCRTLGLDREGDQNLLNVPPGTVISINGGESSIQLQMEKMQEDVALMTEALDDDTPGNMARQQLLAELREASTLMAESVTPEAAQFWRKHVVELQARLRTLHEKAGSTDRLTEDAEEIMRSNERLLASMENTGYVPPSQDEFRQPQKQATNTNTIQQQPSYSSRAAASPSNNHTMDPSDEGAPMVDVVAPANLSGGYRFEAEINDRRFLATVPQGGVRKGETFSCYMRDLENTDTDIPIGRWRDGLFDCFKHGVFHPLLCNAMVCPLIALSQTMTRMGFDFMGRPAHDIPKKGIWSTRGMINTILSFWIFLNGVVFVGMNVKRSNGFVVSSADLTALVIVNLFMLCYLVYTTMATRVSLREKYLIRENRFYDMEDGMSAACCLPCTISQMGRHTASYEDHDGVCCNDTGLSNRLV